MFGRELSDSLNDEVEFYGQRPLWPKGAIAVKYGDAVSGRRVVWPAFLCYLLYESEDALFGLAVIPGEKGIYLGIYLRNRN